MTDGHYGGCPVIYATLQTTSNLVAQSNKTNLFCSCICQLGRADVGKLSGGYGRSTGHIQPGGAGSTFKMPHSESWQVSAANWAPRWDWELEPRALVSVNICLSVGFFSLVTAWWLSPKSECP